MTHFDVVFNDILYFLRLKKDKQTPDVIIEGDSDNINVFKKVTVKNDLRVTGILSAGYPEKQITDKRGNVLIDSLNCSDMQYGEGLYYTGERLSRSYPKGIFTYSFEKSPPDEDVLSLRTIKNNIDSAEFYFRAPSFLNRNYVRVYFVCNLYSSESMTKLKDPVVYTLEVYNVVNGECYSANSSKFVRKEKNDDCNQSSMKTKNILKFDTVILPTEGNSSWAAGNLYKFVLKRNSNEFYLKEILLDYVDIEYDCNYLHK